MAVIKMWLQGLLVVLALLKDGLAWRHHWVSDEAFRPKNYDWRSGRDEFTREARYYGDLESKEHPHGLYYRMVPPPDSSEETPSVPTSQPSQNTQKSFNPPQNQDRPQKPPYQNYWQPTPPSQNPTQNYWQPTPPPQNPTQNYWQPTPPPQNPTQNYWQPTPPPQNPTQNYWPPPQSTVPSQPSQPCWPYQQQFCLPCYYFPYYPCQNSYYNCYPSQPNPTPPLSPQPNPLCQYGNINTPGFNNQGNPCNPGNINPGNPNPGNIYPESPNPVNIYPGNSNPGNFYPGYPGDVPKSMDHTTIQTPIAPPVRNKATIPHRMAYNDDDDKKISGRLGGDQMRMRNWGYRL